MAVTRRRLASAATASHGAGASAERRARGRDECADVLRRRRRQDPVAEVHDVAERPRGLARREDGGGHALLRPEEDAGVDVPLQRACPSRGARASSSGSFQSTETTSPGIAAIDSIRCDEPDAKLMTGTVPALREPREEALRRGAREAVVVGARELARPRVEDLHDVRARLDLRGEVVAARVRELRRGANRASSGRRASSSSLPMNDFVPPPSIAYVASVHGAPQKPITAARPATSVLSALRISGTNFVPTSGSNVLRRATSEARADRVWELRPALVESHLDPHRGERDQDVREEDDAVHPEAPEGLHRDLDRALDVRAEVEKGEALAHLAVLGEVAPGLPHEPYGRHVDGPRERGVDEAAAGGASRGGNGHGGGG